MGNYTFGIKILTLLTVLCITLFSWYSAISYYNKHKIAILLQLRDVTQMLVLPYYFASLATEDEARTLTIPLHGVTVGMIQNSWDAPRGGGRFHEGVDIFASRGTPVFSATEGIVIHVGTNNLGGIIVFVMGPGGVRYYYAHLDRLAQDLQFGTHVTTDTVLGFVGNTGNASTTAPHLHFGVYDMYGPKNPYPLLINR